MDDQQRDREPYSQLGEKAVETLTAWADSSQRVLRELVELSANTAKEGMRLYAELQQGAIEALRDSRAAAGRWQDAWSDSVKDPVQAYQRALISGVDGVGQAFKLLEGQAQAITRAAERLQTSAEQAGKGLQETYAAAVERMKDAYSRS